MKNENDIAVIIEYGGLAKTLRSLYRLSRIKKKNVISSVGITGSKVPFLSKLILGSYAESLLAPCYVFESEFLTWEPRMHQCITKFHSATHFLPVHINTRFSETFMCNFLPKKEQHYISDGEGVSGFRWTGFNNTTDIVESDIKTNESIFFFGNHPTIYGSIWLTKAYESSNLVLGEALTDFGAAIDMTITHPIFEVWINASQNSNLIQCPVSRQLDSFEALMGKYTRTIPSDLMVVVLTYIRYLNYLIKVRPEYVLSYYTHIDKLNSLVEVLHQCPDYGQLIERTSFNDSIKELVENKEFGDKLRAAMDVAKP